MEIKVLFEDKDIIVAVKPWGVPSQPDKTGEDDMVSILTEKYGGNIHVINRLDRPVGGIMVFARNEKAAALISSQMQKSEIYKEYLAVVCGKPQNDEGELTDYVIKNQKSNMSSVVRKDVKGAKEARLWYRLIDTKKDEEFGEVSLLRVRLFTGRHHQIRVQFSSRNLPLWGDTKYNKAFLRRRGFYTIALFSSVLVFNHPFLKKEFKFEEKPKEGIFEKFSI